MPESIAGLLGGIVLVVIIVAVLLVAIAFWPITILVALGFFAGGPLGAFIGFIGALLIFKD